MKFRRYCGVDDFKTDVLDILLKEEDINNLPISILLDSKMEKADDWLLVTITDEHEEIVLVAVCVKPFNILLYEPFGKQNEASVGFLSSELKRIGFVPPGVLAVTELSRRFADVYCESTGFYTHMTMVLMRLDELSDYKKAPGFCRFLIEDDLDYTPSWDYEFCIDCGFQAYTLAENEERIKTRLGKDTHFIWIDDQPVSQAVFGRNTPNGAVINWVYTPPEFRGRGYAKSIVAEVSRTLLDRGKDFCCLFADVNNPISCGVYHKLGYYDVKEFEEIKFDIKRGQE